MNTYITSPAHLWVGLRLTRLMLTRHTYPNRGEARGYGDGVFILDHLAVSCKALGLLTGGDTRGAQEQRRLLAELSPLPLKDYGRRVRPIRQEMREELLPAFRWVRTTLRDARHPKADVFETVLKLSWQDQRATPRLIGDLLLGFDALPQYKDVGLLAQADR